MILAFLDFATCVYAYPVLWWGATLSYPTVDATEQAHWCARAVSLTRPTILTPGKANDVRSWWIAQIVLGRVLSFVLRILDIRDDPRESPVSNNRIKFHCGRRTLCTYYNFTKPLNGCQCALDFGREYKWHVVENKALVNISGTRMIKMNYLRKYRMMKSVTCNVMKCC